MTIDPRDVRVSVTFAEEESRFLAGVVQAASPYFTETQLVLARRVAAKFVFASKAAKAALVGEHGLDAVLEMTDRVLEAYPDVDEVRIP